MTIHRKFPHFVLTVVVTCVTNIGGVGDMTLLNIILYLLNFNDPFLGLDHAEMIGKLRGNVE